MCPVADGGYRRGSARPWALASQRTLDLHLQGCGIIDGVARDLLTWLDRDRFVLGCLYVEITSETTLEFAGIVSASVARQLSMPSPEVVKATKDDDAVMMFVLVGQQPLPGDPRVRELTKGEHPEFWFTSELDWRGPYRATFELAADHLLGDNG